MRAGIVAATIAAAACSTAGVAHVASAADMRAPVYKTPPAAAPVYGWTGFYLGGGVGYGAYTTENRDFELGAAPDVASYSSGGKGWLGTVFAGYDYQFAERWVAGVFADYDFTSVKGRHDQENSAFVGSMKLRSAWALGGRVGYLAAPDTLLYATAGYTQADFSGVTYDRSNRSQSGATYDGWFVGIGAEAQVASNWYGRLEYRYADYGTERVRNFNAGVPEIDIDIAPNVQTIRAGLAYKFGSPGSAYAVAHSAPAVMPAYSWTGFYLGAGVGYGAYTTRNDEIILATNQPSNRNYSSGGKGWLGTVIAGYDIQFAPRWVAGVFADYDFTGLKGQHDMEEFAWSGTLKQKSVWAVGGRLGYLATPSLLFYATGGYTEAKFSGVNFMGLSDGVLRGFLNDATYEGWFVGAGAEAQLTPNWYARLEYRYADYSSERLMQVFTSGLRTDFDSVVAPTVQTIRAGLTYKFSDANPVIAKY